MCAVRSVTDDVRTWCASCSYIISSSLRTTHMCPVLFLYHCGVWSDL